MESTSASHSPVKRAHSNIIGRILHYAPSGRLHSPNTESGLTSKKSTCASTSSHDDRLPNDELVRVLRSFGDVVQQATDVFISLESSLRQTQSTIDRLCIRSEALAYSIQRGDPKRHCVLIIL